MDVWLCYRSREQLIDSEQENDTLDSPKRDAAVNERLDRRIELRLIVSMQGVWQTFDQLGMYQKPRPRRQPEEALPDVASAVVEEVNADFQLTSFLSCLTNGLGKGEVEPSMRVPLSDDELAEIEAVVKSALTPTALKDGLSLLGSHPRLLQVVVFDQLGLARQLSFLKGNDVRRRTAELIDGTLDGVEGYVLDASKILDPEQQFTTRGRPNLLLWALVHKWLRQE